MINITSVIIRASVCVFQNCQTVTPGVNWRCPKKQEPVLVFQESETYFSFSKTVIL